MAATIAVVAGVVAIAVLALFRGMYHLLFSDMDLQTDVRLFQVVTQVQAKGERKPPRAWERWIGGFAFARSLNTQLERANVNLSVGEWVMLWTIVTLGAAVAGYAVSGVFLGGLLLGVMGFVGPRLWLNVRAERRRKAFQDQLVEVLRLLVSSLQAGHGLLQALQVVAEEMPSPSREEFGRVVKEVALGYSMREALEHLVARMHSDDLDLVVTAINIHSEVGGTLSDVLLSISNTITERVRLKGEVHAMTAQQRLSGLIISGMPFVLGTILTIINPDYMMNLFAPGWRWLPAVAVVMIVMGQIFMQRALRIEP